MNLFNSLLSLGSAFYASQRAAGELGLTADQFKGIFSNQINPEQATLGLGDFFSDSFYSTLVEATKRRAAQSRGRGSEEALNYALRLSSPEYNAATSSMPTHRLYEHTAAGHMAALDIMKDKRFENVFKGSPKEADARQLLLNLQSNTSLHVSELGNTQRLLSTFSTLFEGVEGIGDVFNARVETNKRILRANRDRSTVKTPLQAIAAITKFNDMTGQAALPGHVRRLGRGGLSSKELENLDKFAGRLKADNINFTHESKDIFNIRTKVSGKEKDLKFARFRVKDDSFLVPVSDLSEYIDDATGAGIYYRDASASVLYSPTGKVLDIKNDGTSTVKSGMEYMFGEEGKIFNLLQDLDQGEIKSLGDAMFGLPGDSDEDTFRMFEYIDQSKDPRLSLARKGAQVKVMTEDAVPSGVKGIEEFNEYRRLAGRHGMELLPYGSPGSITQNKYFYREVERDKQGRVLSTSTPAFVEAVLGKVDPVTGEFAQESARSRRPVKAFVDPYKVINPGSQRALRAVTGAGGQAGLSQLYAFRSGAFNDLMSGPMAPFVHGSWYLTRKGMEESGNSVGEGVRVRIDPFGEGERLQHAGSHYRISKRNSAGEGLAFNPELERFMKKVSGMTTDDPEERRRLIQEELAQSPFAIKPGDFLGQENARTHVSSVIADAQGQGDLTLLDLKEGDDFFEVVLGRESDFGEGIKTDGSMTSTESSLFNRLTPQEQEDFTKTLQARVEEEANKRADAIRKTRKELLDETRSQLRAKHFDPIKAERTAKRKSAVSAARKQAPTSLDLEKAARRQVLRERGMAPKEFEKAVKDLNLTSTQKTLAKTANWDDKQFASLKRATEVDMLSEDLVSLSKIESSINRHINRPPKDKQSAKQIAAAKKRLEDLQAEQEVLRSRLKSSGINPEYALMGYRAERQRQTPITKDGVPLLDDKGRTRKMTGNSLGQDISARKAIESESQRSRFIASHQIRLGLLQKRDEVEGRISRNNRSTPAQIRLLQEDQKELDILSEKIQSLHQVWMVPAQQDSSGNYPFGDLANKKGDREVLLAHNKLVENYNLIEENSPGIGRGILRNKELVRRSESRIRGSKTSAGAAASKIIRSYREVLADAARAKVEADYKPIMQEAGERFSAELDTERTRINQLHPLEGIREAVEPEVRSEMMAGHIERFMREIDPEQAHMNPELQKLTAISTFVGEGRNLAKGGNTTNAMGEALEVNNIRMARTQQESAVAALNQMSPEQVSRQYTRTAQYDPFHNIMQRELGEAYKEEDTQVMVSHFKTMQDFFARGTYDDKAQQEILGGVFGLEQGIYFEQKILKTSEGQSALESLGLEKSFIKNLEQGVSKSKMVWGLSTLFARDSSSVMAGNDAKMERRFIDHIFGQMTNKNSPRYEETQRLWETIQDKITTADPVYSSALARYNKMAGAKGVTGNVLDFTQAATRAERQEILNKIFEEGGYLKHTSGHIYVPSQTDIARLSIKEEGGGRLLEDMDIADTYTNVHKKIVSDLENLDDSDFQRMKRSVSSVAVAKTVEVFRAPFEGRLKGAISGLLISNLNNQKSAERLGYGVGLSQQAIKAHFKSAMRNASKEEKEVLLEIQRKVLDEGMHYAVAAWQNPQLGPESASVFSGYYDKTLDKSGAIRVDVFGELDDPTSIKSTFRRIGGFMSGKPSTDFDGDRAAVMMMGASSRKRGRKEAEQYWSDQFQLISKASLQKQYDRQKEWDMVQKSYATTIKNKLKILLPETSTIDRATEAYIKGAGQADIGPISNTLSMLHRMNYVMSGTGGISVGTQDNLTNFLQAAEQEAISFKHSSMTPRQLLETRIASIFDNQDVNKGLEELSGLLGDLGFQHAQEFDAKNIKTLGAFAFARASMISMAASKKGEKVTGEAIIKAFNTGVADSEFALHLLNPEQSESLLDAAMESLPASFRGAAKEEMEKYRGNIGKLISDLNANEKRRAEVSSRNAGAIDKAKQAIETVADHTKGLMQNKYARVALIGGAVSAGAYALFNKGYDDTPLSDIPPPPPGRGIMSPRNADLESVANGNLLNDSTGMQNRQNSSMAESMNGSVDQASNIQAPSTIVQKSYLNSATARISNRGMIIDRTNPVEYARAIQARIPGSQVGVNINYNHRIPSDIEREM